MYAKSILKPLKDAKREQEIRQTKRQTQRPMTTCQCPILNTKTTRHTHVTVYAKNPPLQVETKQALATSGKLNGGSQAGDLHILDGEDISQHGVLALHNVRMTIRKTIRI